MGLLDFMASPDAQLGLGLLAAGAPRVGGVSIGQGLQEALGYVDKQRQMKAAEEEQRQKIAYQNALMQEHQQKTAMERAAMDQAMRKRNAMAQIYRPGSQGAPALNMDAMMPAGMQTGMTPVAAVPSREPSIDVQRALQAGYSPDEIQKMDSLRNIGMNEVARTVKGMQGGREVEQQFDKFGRPVGAGMEQFRAPIEVATGDRKQLIDPFSLQPKASFDMAQSPDSKASNQVAWANNAIAQQRLAHDRLMGGKPQFHEGAWVTPPTAQNPQGTAIQVPGYSKPLTESQGNAVSFALRAQNALENLSKNPPIGNFDYIASKAPMGIGNFAMSDAGQQAMNSEKQFIAAVLRKESGAAISKDEYTTYGAQFFPRPGDSDAVLDQKAQNRGIAVQAMRIQAGQSGIAQGDKAFANVKAANATTPETYPKAATMRFNPATGQIEMVN